MIVARSLDELQEGGPSVVTVGTFDGLHAGHRQIVKRLKNRSRELKARSVLVTFDPHPREVVGRGPVQMLTTIEERISLLQPFEVDATLVLRFTFAFSRQTPREFYERFIVDGLQACEMIVGHDHMFGRDREAGVGELNAMGKEFGFSVIEEPPCSVEGEIVSSSKIRDLLLRGDVATAARWLGRYYALSGLVVRGDGRGRHLGFPTANVQPEGPNKLVPAEGVYFVEIRIAGRQYFGMLSIGVNPTFKSDGRRTIEVFIFDFDDTVYGEPLQISFVRRLRGEQKFASEQDLVHQMRKDQEECMKYIETWEHKVR